GNRAILLRHRNDLTGSLRCIDEQLQLSTATGNAQGVMFATANRGEVLGVMGRREEAVAALRQARDMATQWGVTAVVAQLDQLLAATTSQQRDGGPARCLHAPASRAGRGWSRAGVP